MIAKWGGSDDEEEEEEEQEEANLCLMADIESENEQDIEVILTDLKSHISKLTKEKLVTLLEDLTLEHMNICKDKEHVESIVKNLNQQLDESKTEINNLIVKVNDLKESQSKTMEENTSLKEQVEKLKSTSMGINNSSTHASKNETNLKNAHVRTSNCNSRTTWIPVRPQHGHQGLGYKNHHNSFHYNHRSRNTNNYDNHYRYQNRFYQRKRNKYGYLPSERICAYCGRQGHSQYECLCNKYDHNKNLAYIKAKEANMRFVPKRKEPKQIWVPKTNK